MTSDVANGFQTRYRLFAAIVQRDKQLVVLVLGASEYIIAGSDHLDLVTTTIEEPNAIKMAAGIAIMTTIAVVMAALAFNVRGLRDRYLGRVSERYGTKPRPSFERGMRIGSVLVLVACIVIIAQTAWDLVDRLRTSP